MKLSNRFGAAFGALLITATACAKKSESGTVNTAQANLMGTSMTSVVNSLNTNGGASAAGSLAGIGFLAATLVLPTSGSGSATAGLDDGLGQVAQAAGDGAGCSCTGTTCNFTNCTQSGNSYSWSINGTISWAGGHLLCDLTSSASVQGLNYSTHSVCDVTFSPTSINGTLTTGGSFAYANQSTSWEANVAFSSITLAQGKSCPTGGSLSFDGTVTANGKTFGGNGSVTFTGSC